MILPRYEKREIDCIYDDDEPACMYFIPSGFIGKAILVTEDPYRGVESRLVSIQEKDRIIKRYEQN